MFAHPGHEPRDGGISHDERDNEADGEDDPAVSVDMRDAESVFTFARERLQQVIRRRNDHRGNGKEKGKFESRGAGHTGDLTSTNRRHGPRGARKYGGKNLASADPDGLANTHIFHVPGMDAAAGRAF